MRIISLPSSFFFTLLLLTFSNSIYAQQNAVVQLSGAKMRAALSLPKGNSTVQICGLEPGNSYKVIAVPMAHGQDADFEIAPAVALTKGTSNFAFMRDKKNAMSFAAPTACVDIQIKSSSTEKSDDVPMYLSIRCETCPESNAWLQKITGQADQAVLEVQGGFTAQELIENVLVGGGCFQISDLSYDGQSNQIGTFSNGLTNIGFSEGVILATGDISVAVGPNDEDGASFGFGIGTPDNDLSTLTTGATFDMANIEFDFVPTQNQVAFEFAFASEEYCEYVNTQFNDVFGFFISGPGIAGTKNIALIPSTNTPITINNVNHLVNTSLYTHNTTFSGNNCGIQPAFGAAVLELQYDGFTKKMVAVADVIPCQKYHIKLKIADVGDGVWDSAVFLRANSFDAGGEVLASPAYPGGFGVAYESCDSGNLLFKRGNGDTSQPLVINFTVGGTATPGVDYAAINSPVIIPVGETEVLVPVNVIPDLIAEGQENIILLIPNSCACSQGTLEFLINDRPALTLEAADQFLCAGETATLAVSVSGGLPGYTYLWSTGETTASISPTTTGTYTLNVVDGCGGSASVAVELVFTACGGCDAETFIKTVGQLGRQVRGYGIYDSKDGNLYITGLKQDSAAIIKMTPTGAVLWMRTFDVQDGANDRISEIIVDSEGMVVGCGQSGDVQPGVSGFVFRYNPGTNNMQWINTYGLESTYVLGLVELPNGNYLIYDNPHQPVNDNRMLEITRADGTIDFGSPLTQKLQLGNAENFNSAIIHNGKLYGVGRYTNGIDFVNMRHALSRIDLATGNVEWSRLSHVPTDQPARLYGMDLVIEDNHIISVSFGSEVDGELDNGLIFMQKTDLSGNLIWVKRFNIADAVGEVVDEVISVPDGFIMYAHGLKAPSDLYLIKTDKDGVLQWSKKVDYGFNDYVADISTFQSQILLNGNNLFFIASTEGPGASQMLVVKTKLDGTIEGNCDFIKPTLVTTSDVINPANVAVILEKVPFNEEISTIVRMPISTNLLVEDQCKLFVNDSVDISLCLGETVVIGGIVYAQDTSFSIEITGTGGCDTLRTYTIDVLPQPMLAENVTLCPGDSVIIGGQVINNAGVFILSIDGVNGDCDTMVTYTIISSPFQTRSESISFCLGESVTIGGQIFNQSGTVIDTITSATACDTIVTYMLTLQPYQTRSESISFCPGESVTIGGQMFNQSGTVIDTIASATACDTIVTYTLTLQPYQTRSESISFCPGESVTIGGQMFNQSGTVIDTVASANACDTIVTYTLTLLPQPTRFETIAFCPGEIITLGGTGYTQPGTVILTLNSSTGGCDTIATYTLQFSTPAPSSVGITCPASITIGQPSGGGGAVVTYNQPTASSDCVCPGVALTMTSGLVSGSNFPTGTTAVCFTAKDSCGQSKSCCFNVTIEAEDPCDTKVVSCIKYELLTITEDMGKNRTYRIRVTNNCVNKLIYTAIQIPDGLVAIAPADQSIYMAPSGNTYKVRSPNFSPQYSVRYSSISDSINNGESDIFKYTIPAQANVTFIHVVSRLAPYLYLGAHLNTFYCPIGVTPTTNNDRPGGERDDEVFYDNGLVTELLLFPNPTSGELFADFSPWQGQRLNIQVLDSRGQRVQQLALTASDDAQALELPAELPSGLYFLEVLTEKGGKHTGRFVIQR